MTDTLKLVILSFTHGFLPVQANCSKALRNPARSWRQWR